MSDLSAVYELLETSGFAGFNSPEGIQKVMSGLIERDAALTRIEMAMQAQGYRPDQYATAEGISGLIDELHGVTSDTGSGLNMLAVPQAWTQTHRRHRMNVFTPRREDFDILDIARALSMKVRFGGFVSQFYSVAQHSVMVSLLVPGEYALTALLHDATEAYTADVVTPQKRVMTQFQQVEEALWQAIAAWHDLPAEIPACVHHADAQALIWEAKLLLAGGPMWIPESVHPDIPAELIRRFPRAGLFPLTAEGLFLDRYAALTGRDPRRA
ncbi:hypothetical protein IHN63_00175 [Deinococcus sp. 6YEL10]|uniref:hypothetical protein n=1 Tax=Deinococcus sp. 6YEL10 TaxID=2745870 RepID=UPI001E32619E|nr:hypothetical protein [Deinococcus sp. 6YEL10]MCD0159714.1 hypothetical protein [Deinococcus sp. 6YEL10]